MLLDIYPEVELLDCMVMLLLHFLEAAILLSTATSFYTLPNNAQGFQFLHSLTKFTIFYFCCVLRRATLTDMSL